MSGLFNINKPSGLTSHDVVARVRRLTKQRRVGHAGTLDPMATGVLLVCVGQATRLVEYLTPGWKTYRAVVRFGITTDTLDAEGKIITQQDASALTESQLRAILPRFVGELNQIPPIFSALKKDGRPLYKYARAGQQVEIAPRRVTISSLTWLDWQPPDLTLEVVCSAGTYIRSLARDLGEAVPPTGGDEEWLGAHLAALTRVASGSWSLSESVTLDQLQNDPDWQKYLYPINKMLAHLPHVILDESATIDVQHGRQIQLDPSRIDHLEDDDNLVCAYTSPDDFLAILTLADATKNLWQPKKVIQ